MSEPQGPPPEAPAASALDVVRRPERFFAARAAQPPRWMTPFAVVAATVLLNALGGAVLLTSGLAGPQGDRVLALMQEVDMGSAVFAMWIALFTGVAALLSWSLAWLPLRLAVGAHQRLWEIAGFAHVPYLAVSPLQLGATALGGGRMPGADLAISVAAAGVSCLVVWGGLRALAPASAGRGTAAYATLQAVSLLAMLWTGGDAGTASGGQVVM